jgi:UDP-N-acetylglucosamine 2-epimerase (non-hydrolysing)
LLFNPEAMNVAHIVGARPNFMKLAPVRNALALKPSVVQLLIHTGQHYDPNMSDVFFSQLGIPAADINLAVGSGTHAQQTAEIMVRLEPVLIENRPDLVLVYGDVNSTLAASLVAAKLGIRIGHVEAGLRSFDRSMPEEINRLVTDQLSDLLFTHSRDADENLLREGIAREKIHFTGNVMIDSLVRLLPTARNACAKGYPERYALVTLHRPANVDDSAALNTILSALLEIARDLPVIFPAHPRTRQRIADLGFDADVLRVIEPVPYTEFVALQSRATVVITDSGGIQEETTYLGIPCLTLRENTERPVTVALGTNVLVGRDPEKLRVEIANVLSGKEKKGFVPPLWDGHAAERIAEIIVTAAAEKEAFARITDAR